MSDYINIQCYTWYGSPSRVTEGKVLKYHPGYFKSPSCSLIIQQADVITRDGEVLVVYVGKYLSDGKLDIVCLK